MERMESTEGSESPTVAQSEVKITIWTRLRWWWDGRVRSWQNHRKVMAAVKIMRSGTEKQLRDLEAPWPHTERELLLIIRTLAKRQHDYGTCVYAMSLCALAGYYYISHVLGVTGFQASCADLDFIGRSRHMKDGFAIVDYGNLLYPQYREKIEKAGNWERLLADNKEHLREAASQKLMEAPDAHPEVKAHWERLAQA